VGVNEGNVPRQKDVQQRVRAPRERLSPVLRQIVSARCARHLRRRIPDPDDELPRFVTPDVGRAADIKRTTRRGQRELAVEIPPEQDQQRGDSGGAERGEREDGLENVSLHRTRLQKGVRRPAASEYFTL